MTKWIKENTGGGVICAGFTLPTTDVHGKEQKACLILSADMAGLYRLTAEEWFQGSDEDDLMASASVETRADLAVFLLGHTGRIPAEERVEACRKWVEVFA